MPTLIMAFYLEKDAVQDRSADDATLAAHLDPDDPSAGARQIDAAIIACQRARCGPGNRGQLVRHLGMLLMFIAETIVALHGMLWLEPVALTPYFGFILAVPLWTALPIAAIAIWLAVFVSYRIEEKSDQELPEPPPAIRDWLEAHDYRHGIAWWHETRWSWSKLRAHRREIFGYVIWRRTPLPLRAAP